MRKLITTINVAVATVVFIAALLPSLYIRFEGNKWEDIKTGFIVCSIVFGLAYMALRADDKSLPSPIWIVLLFAIFSAFSVFIIGGSLGGSFAFTTVFGIWFSIGGAIAKGLTGKGDKKDTNDIQIKKRDKYDDIIDEIGKDSEK